MAERNLVNSFLSDPLMDIYFILLYNPRTVDPMSAAMGISNEVMRRLKGWAI